MNTVDSAAPSVGAYTYIHIYIYTFIHLCNALLCTYCVYIDGPPYPRIQYLRFSAARKKKLENQRNKRFISFKTRAKRERALTWWKPAAQTRPILDSSSFVPVPTLLRKLATILLLAFSLFELVAALSQCCVQKATRRMQKSVNTHSRLRYFLTNKIFLLQITYRYVVRFSL